MRVSSRLAFALLVPLAMVIAGGCYNSKSSSSSSLVVLLMPIAPQTIDMGQTVNITASVVETSGYPTGGGVTWSLSGSGSLTNQTSTSVTYNAPSSVSMSEIATVTATAVANTAISASMPVTVIPGNAACGTGNEAKLNGKYAFFIQGFDFTSPGYVALAGQFTADGAGTITAGEEDVTTMFSTTGATPLEINPAGSSYSLGPDNRGCLSLATSAGSRAFRFAVGSTNGTVFTKGRLIEFNNTNNGFIQSAAGALRLQDPTAFSTSKFTGNFAFGGSGLNSIEQRFAIAGVADLSSGTVVGGTADADDGGSILSDQAITSGTYTIDSSTGRGALTFSLGLTTVDFAFYVISSSEAFVVTTDPVSLTNPIVVGEAELQSGSFDASSLSGNMVLHDTFAAPSASGVVLGLLSADGVSSISGPTFNNAAGTTGNPTFAETYSVASNGRVTALTGGGANPPIFYLYSTNQGFEVGTGPDSSFGLIENQTVSPFSDASFSGQYFVGAEDPAAPFMNVFSGEITANGSSTSPTLTGAFDESSLSGSAVAGVPFSGSYSIGSNGVGTITSGLDIGVPVTYQIIMISPTKLVFFDNGSNSPAIFVLEQ